MQQNHLKLHRHIELRVYTPPKSSIREGIHTFLECSSSSSFALVISCCLETAASLSASICCLILFNSCSNRFCVCVGMCICMCVCVCMCVGHARHNNYSMWAQRHYLTHAYMQFVCTHPSTLFINYRLSINLICVVKITWHIPAKDPINLLFLPGMVHSLSHLWLLVQLEGRHCSCHRCLVFQLTLSQPKTDTEMVSIYCSWSIRYQSTAIDLTLSIYCSWSHTINLWPTWTMNLSRLIVHLCWSVWHSATFRWATPAMADTILVGSCSPAGVSSIKTLVGAKRNTYLICTITHALLTTFIIQILALQCKLLHYLRPPGWKLCCVSVCTPKAGVHMYLYHSECVRDGINIQMRYPGYGIDSVLG